MSESAPAAASFASSSPAGNVDTSEDLGPVVGVVNWIMMCTTILSVATRLGVKLFISRELTLDDFVICGALAFSIGETVATFIQVANGLGQHQSLLSATQLVAFEKASYASDLLYIANLTLSKIAILLLIREITPIKQQRMLTLGTVAFLVVWGIADVIASALQCNVPQVWDKFGTSCYDRLAFWTYFSITNILTELPLVAFPAYFLWNVRIKPKTLVTIMACFGVRFSIVVGAILQLVYAHRLVGSDVTFVAWAVSLARIATQNLSVITACIPYIKNFMLGLESGMIRVDDDERRRKMSTSYNRSMRMPGGSNPRSPHRPSLASPPRAVSQDPVAWSSTSGIAVVVGVTTVAARSLCRCRSTCSRASPSRAGRVSARQRTTLAAATDCPRARAKVFGRRRTFPSLVELSIVAEGWAGGYELYGRSFLYL